MGIRLVQPSYKSSALERILVRMSRDRIIPPQIDRVDVAAGLPVIFVEASGLTQVVQSPGRSSAFRHLLWSGDFVGQLDLHNEQDPAWLGFASGQAPTDLLKACEVAEQLAQDGEYEACVVELRDVDLSLLLLRGPQARILKLAPFSGHPVSADALSEEVNALLAAARATLEQLDESIWEN